MFVGAHIAQDNIRFFRSSLFWGRTGSGKTLVAVAVAHWLKQAGYAEKCFSNIPLSFGDTPPPDAFDKEGRYNFQHPSARDAVFLLDEAWLNLMDFSPHQIKRIFAFPRHNNQFFLMTSVLPLSSVNKYIFHYIFRLRDLTRIGIPLRLYSSQITGYRDKPVNFGLAFERRFYPRYDTLYNPMDINPIVQEWGKNETSD